MRSFPVWIAMIYMHCVAPSGLGGIFGAVGRVAAALLPNSICPSASPDSCGSQAFENGIIGSRDVHTEKLGVLLLNLGGPEKNEDVEGFLYNLFADPDIIRLPKYLRWLQKPLAYVIAKSRAPKSAANYRSIGGGSPINRYTTQQAALIQQQLTRRGFGNATCYFAMRYWHPFTEETLARMQADNVTSLVVLPLYPHYSLSTSGSSLRALQQAFAESPEVWGKVSHTVVPSWYQRVGYVRAMARLIAEQIRSIPAASEDEEIHILFSAHGVPESYIAQGDPYQKQMEQCVALVQAAVRSLALPRAKLVFHLSYQSRVGPVQWLSPYTDATIVELGRQEVRNLVVVPVSFVSEHIETLEEIDMEYQTLARENGIKNWRRVPALNTEADFIAELADLVVDALRAPALSVAEALGLYVQAKH